MEIVLPSGEVVLFDEQDAELVLSNKWYRKVEKRNGVFYAMRNKPAYATMHRLILGAPVGMSVDHINGNGLDNRRANLRVATHSQNMMNRRNNRHTAPGGRGVSWMKRIGKWQVSIQINNKPRYLGVFADLEDAKAVRECAEHLVYGEFAFCNRPQ